MTSFKYTTFFTVYLNQLCKECRLFEKSVAPGNVQVCHSSIAYCTLIFDLLHNLVANMGKTKIEDVWNGTDKKFYIRCKLQLFDQTSRITCEYYH
jgi:hypothetical protein